MVAGAIRRYELLDDASRKHVEMRVLAITVTVLGLATLVLLLL